MLYPALCLLAYGTSALQKSDPVLLPSNAPLVAEARRKNADIFAFVPEGQDPKAVPATVNELEAWSLADERRRVGPREFFVRNAEDMFPRDLLSLESRRFGILRHARQLLLNPTNDPGSPIPGYARLSQTAPSARQAILDNVYTGYGEVPADAREATVGVNIAPAFVLIDARTGDQKSVALDRLPKPPGNLALPSLVKSTELEDLRTRSLAALGKDWSPRTVDLSPGVYPAKKLFDLATEGIQPRIRLDKRFHDFRVLVVPAKPLTSLDLLTGVARTLDLYPRSFPDGWLLAISPDDPYAFYVRKRAVEERNLVLDILRKLYEAGRLPAYVPPDAFCIPDADLPPGPRDRLLADLSQGASSALASEKPETLRSLTEPGRYQVRAHLSIGLILRTPYSTVNAATIYP